jgi:transcriptional regulator with XRE-family HTH domain
MVGEFGRFLRARRARVRPEDVGLPAGQGIRRTPGLRREELAALAGVSIHYLTRLEQGKETNPSAGVLDALAGALLLDADAHTHLYALANQAAHRTPPARRRDHAVGTQSVRPATEQLLERLRPSPAYVLNRISDVLAANPEAVALFAGLDRWPRARWNTIRYVFLHPTARELFADWQAAATSGVANLHAALANPAADGPDPSSLIEELSASSPEFVRLWERYDIRPRRSHPKTFHHPDVGPLTLHHEVLQLSDEGLRLAIDQAEPGSADETAMTLLSLAGRDPLATITTP